MSKQKDASKPPTKTDVLSRKPDTRPNISTADDVNVDEDNAVIEEGAGAVPLSMRLHAAKML